MNAANDRAIIHRLLTGVPGLDNVLGGGLPEFSFNVIAGPPGSGKTTLAHQIMFALASAERPARYFTVLGEPPLKMLRYQQEFDFFDAGKLRHAIHFINLAEEAASGDLGKVLHRILAEVESKGPGLQGNDNNPVFHGGRRPDLAAPERAAQLGGAQTGDRQDARASDPGWPALVPHRQRRHPRVLAARGGPAATAGGPASVAAARAHGCRGAGRHAGGRSAARLLAPGGRPVGCRQEHPRLVLPGGRGGRGHGNGIRLGGMLHQHEGLLGGRATLRKRDAGEPTDPSWGSPNPKKSS
ncbi:hypothetical protein GCM10028796_25920 [Ramlibacter monticola]|uniref:KaiC-like domain-containing protein n=1 Tax=Ramlibacter monticola TaxID=1926872 RepID=A0A937CW65_9BURK|nr:ATPase domain-containing protein [Ramlibacter monticola]MBL0393647.1 hypothetical protein [Ramlibacter monticola]